MQFFSHVMNNRRPEVIISLVSILLSKLLAEAADTPP